MTEKEKKNKAWPRAVWKWTRTLHIYLSMFALVLFLFFSVTGFMLNHSSWFGIDKSTFESEEASIPVELCQAPDRVAIIKILTQAHHVGGTPDGFEVDENEIHVLFKRPAHLTDAFIDRYTGDMEIRTETGNLFRFLTDVHMGEHTGPFGHRIIDVTAILFFTASLTGLILCCTLPKRRTRALMALLTAALAFLAFLARI